MAARTHALFAEAFLAALSSRRALAKFSLSVRASGRAMSSAANAPSEPEPRENGGQRSDEASQAFLDELQREPRLADVTDNLLSDFTEPMPTEQLEAGRKRSAPKGYLTIARSDAAVDLKTSYMLLEQLRARADAATQPRGGASDDSHELKRDQAEAPTSLDSVRAMVALLAKDEAPTDPPKPAKSKAEAKIAREMKRKEKEKAREKKKTDKRAAAKTAEKPTRRAKKADAAAVTSSHEEPDSARRKEKRVAPHKRTLDPSVATAPAPDNSLGKAEFWETGWKADQLAPGKPRSREFLRAEVPVQTDDSVTRSGTIDSTSAGLSDVDVGFVQPPIAQLAHGLDRVLFNPGVHWVRDPHSGVYNFDPYIQTVPEVRDFDFDRLYPYTRSSRDTTLRRLALEHGKKFAGSSSSLTGLLSQLYRLISGDKPVDLTLFTAAWRNEPRTFTSSQCMPVSVTVTNRDGVWMVDPHAASPEDDEKHILLWLGTMLEKFLTRTPEHFKELQRSSPPPAQPPSREAYRYSKSDSFLMRGQLDCVDPRLPGTGVFDIKTRASMLVRLDRWNMKDFAGYEIRKQNGLLESFEREVYDLTRSAFLKYTMQARIGNMDGCIVAYHNTVKIMGFEYFPIAAMEERLYGNTYCGDRVFVQCLRLLEEVLEAALSIYPDSDVKLLVDKMDQVDRLDVYIKPLNGSEEGESPIALLHVDAQVLFDDTIIDKAKAMTSPRTDWVVKYKVSRSTHPDDRLQQYYLGALTRQEFGFPLTPGATVGEMEELYRTYSVTGRPLTDLPERDPEAPKMTFYAPGPKIRTLRSLARRGHLRMLEAEESDVGKARVVWAPLAHNKSAAAADLYQAGDVDAAANLDAATPAVMKVLARHDPRISRRAGFYTGHADRLSLPAYHRLQSKAASLVARLEKRRLQKEQAQLAPTSPAESNLS